jgi:two-component system sensor histidine kinase RegB
MARAVSNIVQNGLDASPDDAQVDVALSLPAADRVRISVSDRGVGIDPARLERVGEPFFTTKAAGHGLGLGVFVARTTTERMQGSFDMQSTRDQGTRVTMTLPRQIGEREDQGT